MPPSYNFEKISCIAFSHDGTRIATSAADTGINVFDAMTGDVLHLFEVSVEVGHANCLDFSPHDSLLASGSDSGHVEIWDLKRGIRTESLRHHEAQIDKIAFSPDGNWIASASKKDLRLWNMTTRHVSTLSTHISDIHFFAFSPNGSTIATGSGGGCFRLLPLDSRDGTNGKILRYDKPTSRSKIFGFLGSGLPSWAGGTPSAAMFRPRSDDLVLAFLDGSWIVLDVAREEVIMNSAQGSDSASRDSTPCNFLALSPDAELIALAYGGVGPDVKVWETGSGSLRQWLLPYSVSGPLAFSQDSNLMAASTNNYANEITIWDTERGTFPDTIRRPHDCPEGRHGLEVSGDGSIIAIFSRACKMWTSSEYENIVSIYDAKTGQRRKCKVPGSKKLEATAPMKFSLDMRHLAVSLRGSGEHYSDGNKNVRIWEAASGKLKQTIHVEWSYPDVHSIEFSSDGLSLGINEDRLVKLNRSCRIRASQMQQILAGARAPLPRRAARLHRKVSMSRDKAWIMWDGVNVLWVPPDHRLYTRFWEPKNEIMFKTVPLDSDSVRVVYPIRKGVVVMTLSKPESPSLSLGKST